MSNLDHPNDEGRWTRLDLCDSAALWKRERQTFPPLTQFYLVAPLCQHEILYDEAAARRAFASAARHTADVPAADPMSKPPWPG